MLPNALNTSTFLTQHRDTAANAVTQAARMTRTWQSILLFPIPSIIYWVHNNVQVCACNALL